MSKPHAKEIDSGKQSVSDQHNSIALAVKKFREDHPSDKALSRRQKKNLHNKERIAAAIHRAITAEITCGEAVEARIIEEKALASLQEKRSKAKTEWDRAIRELQDLKEAAEIGK